MNGLRAILRKNALNALLPLEPGIVCLQETRLSDEQDLAINTLYKMYGRVEHHIGTVGRSGTLICGTTIEKAPQRAARLYDDETGEGRVTAVIVGGILVMSCYAPNTGREHRQQAKQRWMQDLIGEVHWLRTTYKVVMCGDWNAILDPEDVHDYNGTLESPGNYDFERDDLYELTRDVCGMVDVWRLHNPGRRKYTYWDYRTAARRRGLGWRIDSFLVDPRLVDQVTNVQIHDNIEGSDHCPVSINIEEK